MEPPKTIRDIRSFLGMASYYREYVPNFSKIAKPLNALTRKHAKFAWTQEAQSDFETLTQLVAGSWLPLLVAGGGLFKTPP